MRKNIIVAILLSVSAVLMPASTYANNVATSDIGGLHFKERTYEDDTENADPDDDIVDWLDTQNELEGDENFPERNVVTDTLYLQVGESAELPRGWSEGHSEGYSKNSKNESFGYNVGNNYGTHGESIGIGAGTNLHGNTSSSWSVGGIYEWESEDEDIAEVETVDERNRVTGISEGTTDVVGYTDGVEKTRYTIIVTDEDNDTNDMDDTEDMANWSEDFESDSQTEKVIHLFEGQSEDLPSAWSETHSDIYTPSFDDRLDIEDFNRNSGFSFPSSHTSGWSKNGTYEWESADDDIAEIETVDGKTCVVGSSEGTTEIIGYTNGEEKTKYMVIVENDNDRLDGSKTR